MQGKNIDISKWILLLTFSQVSCFTVLQINDVNKELVNNILDTVKNTRINDENYFPNIETVSKIADKNIVSRKNQDFMHKILVKRIVPHGYKIKKIEYDNKFKTLFKPLMRLHKKKTDSDDSSEVEDRYDLVYVVDDKRLEDETNLSKDDSLLKPFTTDNMDIKLLPSDNKVEYIINSDGKKKYNDPRPNNQFSKFGHSRYELFDNTNQIKVKQNPNNALNLYIDDNKSKQVLGTQKEHWIENDEESPKYKYIRDLLDKISKINKNKQLRESKTKPERHRFVSIGQFSSKQLKPEKNIQELEENVALPSIYVNNKNYIEILDLLQKSVQKQTKENKKEIQPLGWFGPVGVMNSKQLMKTNEYDNAINLKINKLKNYQPENNNDWLGSLKQMIQEQQQQASDEDRSMGYQSKEESIRELFRSIGSINPKHKHDNWERETDTDRVPVYFIKPKDSRQRDQKYIQNKESKFNKFTLLNEIAQIKASNLDNERKERLNKQEADKTEDLRSHIKSGEEEEEAKKQMELFDYHDERTTEKYVTYKPKYPFWNEWTYDKQIPQDVCKGKSVQLGRVCVNAWA